MDFPLAFLALLLLFGSTVILGASVHGLVERRLGAGLGAGGTAFWPVTGLALLLFAGSILNLLGIYRTGLFIAMVILPYALLPPVRKTMAAGMAGVDRIGFVTWILLAAALAFIPAEFNLNDDGPGYLAFVEKLIQLGGTGAEPFSERRLYTLGGHFALQAPFWELFGPRSISVSEPGLGILLLGWLVSADSASIARRRAAGLAAAAFLTFSFFVGARPVANLVPAYLQTAFVAAAALAALRQMMPRDDPESEGSGWLLLVAISAAASLLIRITPITFYFPLALLLIVRFRRRPLQLLCAGVVGSIILLPSMLAQWVSSRTLLYPLLGHGVQIDQFERDRSLAAFITEPITYLPILAGAVLLLFPSRRSVPARAALLATAILAVWLVAWQTAGVQLARYTFPVTAGTLMALLLGTELERLFKARFEKALVGLAGLQALMLLLLVGVAVVTRTPRAGPLLHRFDMASRVAGPLRQPCRAAQALTTPGSSIFVASAPCAYAMDFPRNRILIHDQLAAAAPAPGFLPASGRTALRATLEREGIAFTIWPAGMTSSPMPKATNGWGAHLVAQGGRFTAMAAEAVAGQPPLHRNELVELHAVSRLR